jgi:uncharacterized membrane protein YwaF
MRLYKWIKTFSLASYLLILLPGWMIALPLGMDLLFWCFESNVPLQLCAIAGILGLLAIIFNRKIFHNKWYVDIIGFTLLILPLINRLTAFPKELGNFKGFYIPAIFFIILFVIYIIIKYWKFSN